MNDIHRVVVAVLVSAATSTTLCLLLTTDPPSPPPRVEIDSGRIDRLEAKVELLELTPAPAAPHLPVAEVPSRVEVVRVDHGPEQAKRIDDLDARVRRLEQVAAAQPLGHEDPRLAHVPHKDEAVRVILDPASDVAQKMKAHEALRSVPDAYSPAMVAELLRIGTTNPDGAVRAQVWCFLDGQSKLSAIVAPLVRTLQADGDARAREEAADTLGSYLDDPIVEPALRQAANGDASERVRAKAARTLKYRRSFSPVARTEPRK